MGSTSSMGMGVAAGLQLQQIADAGHGPLVDQRGELLVLLVVAAS